MSIINDALRKANQERNVYSLGQKLEGNPMSLKAANEKKRSMNWGPLFVVLVAGVIVGPIAAPYFSNPFRQAAYETVSSGLGSENRKGQFGIEEMGALRAMPPAAVMGSPAFNLSGIVFSHKGTDSFCIINDQVLKPGDTIRGATLVSVTAEKAVLNYKGEEIVLTN